MVFCLTNPTEHSPVTHGLRLGLNASSLLASAYAVLGLFTEVGRQMWLTHDLRIWMLPIVRMSWAGLLPFYFLMVLGAALVFGSVTGALIGELWANLGHQLDGRVFALLVSAMCALIVVGLHAALQVRVDLAVAPLDTVRNEWPANSLGLLVSYPFLVGVPSMVYVATGAWASYYFWQVRQPDE